MTAERGWDVRGQSDSDAELARASAAGDKRAFAVIYDRYADRLHDFCVGMLADRDGAADCVQDVFCTAATRLAQLRDPDKLRPWLYSIARNEALRRIRERRRETPSDELPDAAASDPGPDSLAARTELADLIADAAGGLSDRDRSVLELAFRHGLSGPDLAEALGVSPSNANTIVHRLRDTIERSLGALLVSRRARSDGECQKLAGILDGWDGQFSVLMRKRVSRHIESCDICDGQRRRLVSPTALLGATPVFIPAPAWLRDRTLSQVQLTSSAGSMARDTHDSAPAKSRGRSSVLPIAAFVVTLVAALGLTSVWLHMQTAIPVSPVVVGDSAPMPPAPPSIAPPPSPSPTVSIEPVLPSKPVPPTRPTTAAPPPSAEPTAVVPTPAPEPPPPAVAPLPHLPPLPLPPLPPWPQWPGGDPDGPNPNPGSQFTGPSDIVDIPPGPTVP